MRSGILFVAFVFVVAAIFMGCTQDQAEACDNPNCTHYSGHSETTTVYATRWGWPVLSTMRERRMHRRANRWVTVGHSVHHTSASAAASYGGSHGGLSYGSNGSYGGVYYSAPVVYSGYGSTGGLSYGSAGN